MFSSWISIFFTSKKQKIKLNINKQSLNKILGRLYGTLLARYTVCCIRIKFPLYLLKEKKKLTDVAFLLMIILPWIFVSFRWCFYSVYHDDQHISVQSLGVFFSLYFFSLFSIYLFFCCLLFYFPLLFILLWFFFLFSLFCLSFLVILLICKLSLMEDSLFLYQQVNLFLLFVFIKNNICSAQ